MISLSQYYLDNIYFIQEVMRMNFLLKSTLMGSQIKAYE